MYATIQKWGNSQGLRLPKKLLDSLGIKESDKVELTLVDDAITIRPVTKEGHKTLEERLTAFYGVSSEELPRIENEEISWGKALGTEL